VGGHLAEGHPDPGGVERPRCTPAIVRVHRTLALVAEADASERPWAYLEYYCHSCVLRMDWPGFVPAFLDPEYDTHITEIEGIERGRALPLPVFSS
jgi:hypothetical protein